jgi:hypothetical protein
VVVVGGLFSLSAAPASIGIVRSYGEFRVDGAAVRGNSTLMAGDVVETMSMNTTVRVGGTELTLMPESRAALYGDHTTLQKGTTLVRGASSHALEVGTLRIVPLSAHSLVEVGYSDRKQVTVSAHSGAANVFTSSGELLASLNPGGALSFSPSAGASGLGSGSGQAAAGVSLKGRLTKNGDKYYLTDGGKTYEITSSTVDLAQYVGKVITTVGSVVGTAGTVTTVSVTAVTVAGTAAAAGLSTAAIVGVVASIGTATTFAGLGVAGAFSSGGKGSVSVP